MLTRIRGWFKWRWAFLALGLAAMPLVAGVILALSVPEEPGVVFIGSMILGALFGGPAGQALILARNERPGGPWDFGD